jgi:hypothetical protein
MRQGCAGYRFDGDVVYHAPTPRYDGGGSMPGDNPLNDGLNPWTDNVLEKGDLPAEAIGAYGARTGLKPA